MPGDANYSSSTSAPPTAHTVNAANTTTTITSDSPDPSGIGQSVMVNYTVVTNPPSSGSASGNVVVTVAGGAETCTGTVASGGCSLALNASGSPRVLTAAFQANANYNAVPDTEDHIVCTAAPVVNNNNDSGSGSLRQAVIDACDGATVTFAAGLASPITLTTGLIDIGKNLTITGPGANVLTVSGNNASKIFRVNGAFTVTISGLTISNGVSSTAGGGIENAGGILTVSNSVVSGNISNNASGGGGVYSSGATAASVTIRNSTISGNSAPTGTGGGVASLDGTLVITNSTISGNSASSGGGIADSGVTATISNSTVSDNSATNGGGVLVNGSPTVTLNSSIVANSTAGGDCVRVNGIVNGSFSLIEDGLTCISGTNTNNLIWRPVTWPAR
jgi:hypothetical protein